MVVFQNFHHRVRCLIVYRYIQGALSKFLISILIMMTFFSVAAAAKELNVVLFSMPYSRALAKMEGDFEKKTGIAVNIQVMGQDLFERSHYRSTFGNDVDSNQSNEVDVIHTPIIQLQKWIKAGYLKPITEQVNQLESKGDILKGPLNSYWVNESYWAVPFQAGIGMMAYRKDIFEAAGISSPPKTWEDVLSVAEKIHSEETAAIAMRVAPGQGFNMFVYPQIMRAYGGTFFKNYPHDLTPNMNTPEGTKALDLYSELMSDYGPQGIEMYNFNDVVSAMQNGEVAMIFDASTIVAQTLDKKKSKYADNIDIAAVPEGPAGRSPAMAVHGLGVPSSAKDIDKSFAFIKWATSEEVLTKIALSDRFADFTRTSVGQNEQVIEKYNTIHPGFIKLRVQMLNEAIAHYRPLIPQWPAIGQVVGENISDAVNGFSTSQEALQASDEDIADIMDQ